jgi:hypothetical protein
MKKQRINYFIIIIRRGNISDIVKIVEPEAKHFGVAKI